MSLSNEQEAAIIALYHEMYRKMVQIAYGILNNVDLAEEATQEAFLIACKKPDDVINSANPQGWMVKTLHFVIKNMQRVLTTQEKARQAAGRTQESLVHLDDYSDIEFSDLLTTEEYRLFRCVTLEKYKMREAAELFGINEEACKKRVQRIRLKLRNQLIKRIN